MNFNEWSYQSKTKIKYKDIDNLSKEKLDKLKYHHMDVKHFLESLKYISEHLLREIEIWYYHKLLDFELKYNVDLKLELYTGFIFSDLKGYKVTMKFEDRKELLAILGTIEENSIVIKEFEKIEKFYLRKLDGIKNMEIGIPFSLDD